MLGCVCSKLFDKVSWRASECLYNFSGDLNNSNMEIKKLAAQGNDSWTYETSD